MNPFRTARARWISCLLGAAAVLPGGPMWGVTDALAASDAPTIAPISPLAASAPVTPEEELPTIEGVNLARVAGGFLGLTIHEGRLRVRFYDEKKKPQPVPAAIARAAARWDAPGDANDDRTVLARSDDDTALLGARPIRPPYVYKVYLTLLDEAGQGVESHIADLRELK